MTNNNRVMVMLTPEEIERLGRTAADVDDRTKEEKISDYASTRERDRQGRFLSKREMELAELESFYYTPYKVVYKPKYRGPDHVLVRHEEMYWYQKAHVWFMIGLAFLGSSGVLIGIWEGFKAWAFK